MRRLPTLLAAAALCVGVLTTITPSQAQGPGGGRGGRGGPGGGFGFGGPGGFGGFGGGGSGIDMNLLRNEAVQKEIKLTDSQKSQLDELRTAERNKRQQVFEAMKAANGGGNNFGGNNNGGGNNGGGNNGGGRRGGRNNNNAGGGGPGFGGPGGPGGGGPGGFFGGMNPAVMEQMQALSNQTQAALKKILTQAQAKRVQEISLRRQDVFAVARPDIAQKLNLNEDDLLQVQEITQQMGGEMFTAMRQRRGNGPRFTDDQGKPLSREEMRKKMEEPEVKAQMEKAREEQQQQIQAIRDRAKSQIAKVLSKKQKAAFDKMLGEPFDLSLLDNGRGPFGRGGPGGGNGGPPSNAATPKNNTASATKAAPAAATPKTASAAPAESAPKKKRSLGSRRDD